MMMNLFAVAAALVISCTNGPATPTIISENVKKDYVTINEVSVPAAELPEELTLSGYMRAVYTATQSPELDESVFQAFHTFEVNKNSSTYVKVYSGSYDECLKFRDYFNLNYGFTPDFRVTVMKSGSSYFVAFTDTLNADGKIDAYLTEVKKAQEIARALNAGSNDATIQNVINWVKGNAKYYYSDDTTEGYIAHYYGIYSNKEVLCEGYAMAVYQLCAMNGIKASLVDLVSPTNVPHAVNKVSYSDRECFVDTTKINPVSNDIWEGYTDQ